MIYTDFKIFFSDDPSDNYKELHELAQSVGIDRGYHCNSGGRLYYMVRRKRRVIKELLLRRAMVVSKQTVKYYLLSGYLNVTIQTNFERYKNDDFFEKLFKEILDLYDLPYTRFSIQVKVYNNQIVAYNYANDTTIKFTARPSNPEGKITIKREDTIEEIDVPAFAKKKLLDNAKPLSLLIARNKTNIK
jgi:hypothetical protein